MYAAPSRYALHALVDTVVSETTIQLLLVKLSKIIQVPATVSTSDFENSSTSKDSPLQMARQAISLHLSCSLQQLQGSPEVLLVGSGARDVS